MIDVQSVSMMYGHFQALKDISFQARNGEVLGLLGPNGAGKTTAMRILTTYLYPSSGQVTLDGIGILEKPLEARKNMGYLPENAPLYLDMQVEEYLRFVGGSRGIHGDHLKQRLSFLQESCQLKPVWKHLLSELSKGYRQRVGLAQALIHDPQVLILDEPTSGLDPLQILGIRSLIKSLAKEKTIIFSTHILPEVEALADRIVIMSDGCVIAQGTQKELSDDLKRRRPGKDHWTLEDIFIGLLLPEKKS